MKKIIKDTEDGTIPLHYNLKLWALGVSSALLLSVPYIVPHTGMIMFVAFLPLLAAEYLAGKYRKKNFWIIYYSSFVIWNIITTWWIVYATAAGAILAVLVNALQMSLIFRVFRWSRKIFTGIIPYILLTVLWIGWEHLYFTWQVSWPWLVLGNAFATSIKSIQWYSITGSLGGSLWILIANIMLFRILVRASNRQKITALSAATAALVIIPAVFSHCEYYNFFKGERAYKNSSFKEVSILQPNIDPYDRIPTERSQYEKNNILFSLADKAVTKNTFLALAPETFDSGKFSSDGLVENTPNLNASFVKFRNYAAIHNVNVIYGALSRYLYMPTEQNNLFMSPAATDPGEAPTPTARNITGSLWYDVLNTAVFISPKGDFDFYHKSKLVIMAESMPSIGGKQVPKALGIKASWASGGFGTQEFRTVFTSPEGIKFGTAICYESVYGNFYRDYIKEGAQFMTIITDDGWWRNTAGHRQHLSYASLRAIETRRDIARCANTGTSAFVNSRGDIVSSTGWWKRTFLNGKVRISKEMTPFVKYGDITGTVSMYAALLMLILTSILATVRYRREKRSSEK